MDNSSPIQVPPREVQVNMMDQIRQLQDSDYHDGALLVAKGTYELLKAIQDTPALGFAAMRIIMRMFDESLRNGPEDWADTMAYYVGRLEREGQMALEHAIAASSGPEGTRMTPPSKDGLN